MRPLFQEIFSLLGSDVGELLAVESGSLRSAPRPAGKSAGFDAVGSLAQSFDFNSGSVVKCNHGGRHDAALYENLFGLDTGLKTLA